MITENQTFSAEITLLLLFDKAEMTVMVFVTLLLRHKNESTKINCHNNNELDVTRI